MDIGIAGAGIGGLCAATCLARDGHKVTVYDRFEAPKPVGSGLMLQPTGLAVLQALGLRSEIDALGAPIERLEGRTVGSGQQVLNVRFAALKQGMTALGVQRRAIFDVLWQAASQAGVDFELGRAIADCKQAQGAAQLILEGATTTPRYDLIVDALGANSGPAGSEARHELPFGALWATVPWADASDMSGHALDQRYDGARRMAGVMPSGLGGSRRTAHGHLFLVNPDSRFRCPLLGSVC